MRGYAYTRCERICVKLAAAHVHVSKLRNQRECAWHYTHMRVFMHMNMHMVGCDYVMRAACIPL